MQIIKQILRKAEDSKQDAFLSLLEYRNTPISNSIPSPAQLLMSRKQRTKLPIARHQLKPHTIDSAQHKLQSRQQNQKKFYDRNAKSLPPLKINDSVRVRDGRTWVPAKVIDKHTAPRSYIVLTENGMKLRRNRAHLLATKEDIQVPANDNAPIHIPVVDNMPVVDNWNIAPDPIMPNDPPEPVIPNEPPVPDNVVMHNVPPNVPVDNQVRKSNRMVKKTPRYIEIC